MSWCWHRWSQWSWAKWERRATIQNDRTTDVHLFVTQKRACKKCGFAQWRVERF